MRFKALDYVASVSFLVYASSATLTPICLLIVTREFGLSLTQGGMLEAVRAGLIFITLLISGFIAAYLGKIRALGIGSLLLGTGLFVYAFSPAYSIILLAAGLLARLRQHF